MPALYIPSLWVERVLLTTRLLTIRHQRVCSYQMAPNYAFYELHVGIVPFVKYGFNFVYLMQETWFL